MVHWKYLRKFQIIFIHFRFKLFCIFCRISTATQKCIQGNESGTANAIEISENG